VAKAKPDGYKIGFLPNNPMATQPQLQNVPYDLSSFKYVCKVYEAPYVLIASPQAPFKTFEEFVEFAKAKPDNLIYASPGLGSHSHFASLTALKAIGATGIHTPFAGGGKIAPALLNGTVMATAEAPSLAISNDLKVLVTFTKERLKQLPDVPTMAEFGYEIDSLGPFGGLEVPAGTSDAVVAKLEDACSTAVASDSYQKVMDRLGANRSRPVSLHRICSNGGVQSDCHHPFVSEPGGRVTAKRDDQPYAASARRCLFGRTPLLCARSRICRLRDRNRHYRRFYSAVRRAIFVAHDARSYRRNRCRLPCSVQHTARREIACRNVGRRLALGRGRQRSPWIFFREFW
jgi:hypothetical protein